MASFQALVLRLNFHPEFAALLEDLRIPAGNRLEALKGDPAGRTAYASTTGTA